MMHPYLASISLPFIHLHWQATTLAAIAWTLIHFCWQAAAIAAVYRLLSLAFARRTSHARYLLALGALLLMLTASVATFAWELRSTSSFQATSDPTITMRHVRAAGICARAARTWFASHGLSWDDFLSHGISASRLRATGDGLAERAIREAERG